ncbi:MAG: TraR/DksA family transcriptional regulator [Nitrospinota bacterium]|nr:TraR/DksA family transcriptional regulator [Nitrospinota bacterium]
MTRQELESLKNRLINLRNDLIEGVDKLNKHSNDEFQGEVPDVNDEATRTYSRQVLLSKGEVDRQQLKLVEEALDLIAHDETEYGICIDCEEEIPFQRLEAAPYVKRCVDCKTMYEERLKLEL